ncbi:helix-turn-helix domain-containing protein [Nocardiopsis valliformis]|uniref:helix-turn-helix domain-containing protein n=1 Tax=Nocardiopsis valliformis TaxID=239974 RepID=UPI000A0663F3|nr:helix-turn-helix transcriptional regulator [Nocardiopsis valliformis]
MAEASPTVARRILAKALRERREAARITGGKAAGHAGMHAGTLSRVESASTRIQPGTAQLLMRFYGASDEECEAAFQLAHLARRKGWWRSYKSVPKWFEPYLGLEADAVFIRDYRDQLLPDLFQTEEYARLVAQACIPALSEVEARERVEICLKRQERLTGLNPLRLDVVMSESALRLEVGGATTMKPQLSSLLERCDLPNVTCRIFPYSAGAFPHQSGSFTSLSFEEENQLGFSFGEVVYQGHEAGASYLEDEDTTTRFRAIFENLRDRALSEDDSRALIERVLTEYS